MSAGSGLTACSNIQARLNSIWETNSTNREPMPMVEYLMSAENRNGLQMEINGKGKLRTVDVVYFPRLVTGSASEDQARTCTASTTVDDSTASYSMDTSVNVQSEFTFTYGNLVSYCQDNENFYAEQVMRHVDLVARDVAVKSATQASAILGEWNTHAENIQDSSLSPDWKTFSTRTRLATTGADQYSPYPFTFANIRRAANMSNFGGPVRMFGGLDFSQAYDQMAAAGGMSQAGVDVGELARRYGIAAEYDYSVTQATGSYSKSWALGQGALQLLQFNMYDNSFNGRNDETVKLGIITDPMTGIQMDISFKIDCETVHTVITATTKVVGLPSDLYQAGDDLSGVTRFAQVDVDNS